MKRIIITGAALLAIVPASIGLVGNAAFSQNIPVRVPSQVTPVSSQSTHAELGDDKGGLTTHVEPGDDKGGLTTHVEPGDDNGGLSTHVEPGDDNGGHGHDDSVKTGSDDGSGHK
jgi:hypothetical protein